MHKSGFLTLAALTACLPPMEQDGMEIGDSGIQEDLEVAFVDDCKEGLNDTIDDAVFLDANSEEILTGIQLCKKEIDYYRFYLPPKSFVTLNLLIEGSGKNATDSSDLDLLEVGQPDNPVSGLLDLVADEADQAVDTLWYSASDNPSERLGWYNPNDQVLEKFVAVDGYRKAESLYNLSFRVAEFHEGNDCNEFFSKIGQKGPCNEIMQFPQATSLEDGYVVSHEPRYSNLRRELIYLVRWAAAETAATFPGTNPIGLLDMSQADGDTPGRQDDQLRHPEGTHVEGNDIDIAYYQTVSNNLGRSVCPENGYFCTDKPDILDAKRSAFFISRLMKTESLRVIGVDSLIYPELIDAARELQSEGLLRGADVGRLKSFLAYGEGWPFHQHHLHFSWNWEKGWSAEDQEEAPCALPVTLDPPAKIRRGPGLD